MLLRSPAVLLGPILCVTATASRNSANPLMYP
jgi:hypothetical protein